ncbi:MAG TPA: hypothetical protein VK427_14425 [Kofleriaceae bacterium]|nr:hypothetical protein [Kofleriaceae bacterium]
MTYLKRFLIPTLLVLGFVAGCTNAETGTTTFEGPAPTDVERQELDEALYNVEALTLEQPKLDQSTVAAASTCAAGAVGDTKWVRAACCSGNKQRWQLHRCDGRYWRPTVNYKCTSTTCAL